MPAVPGLRSPHDTLGSLVYVGRMFDKIRLHDRGELPEDFLQKLGWHDDRSEFLQDRVTKSGLANRGIHTFFDLIEIDEDRPIRSFYA